MTSDMMFKVSFRDVFLIITSYTTGNTVPMRSLDALNSIDNNQNIAWDKRAYSLITETRSYGIASNDGWMTKSEVTGLFFLR